MPGRPARARGLLSRLAVVVTVAQGKVTFRRTFPTAGRYYVPATALAGPANASNTSLKKYVNAR